MQRKQDTVGLIFAGLCALNGAIVPAVAKLTTGRADPLSVAAATNVFAGIAAALLLFWFGGGQVLRQEGKAAPLVLVAALGTSAANLFLYHGASRASAIETVLCLQIEPAYSLLFAWWVLGERPTRRRILATATILGGIACAVGGPGGSISPGIWSLLAAPICWQASHLVVLRLLRDVPPEHLTAARYIHGAWQLVVIWLLIGNHADFAAITADGRTIAALVFQGVVLSYAGTLVWYQGLVRLGLARCTAIVVPSVPLLSLVASFLILGEVPSLVQWLGLLLTAAGVLAFVRDRTPASH